MTNMEIIKNEKELEKGFYTTPLYEQAVNWVLKFKKRGDKAI